jgi:hypothetical protein
MMKLLAAACLSRICAVVVTALLIAALPASLAHAKGKGPIGLWPATERYVLLADKSLPGIVLVDLSSGTSVERLLIEGKQQKGVASCLDCSFALISGSFAEYWLLHFDGTVRELLQKNGKLGLDQARLEPFTVSTGGEELTDGRMCLVSDDGAIAYVASLNDHTVFRIDFAAQPNATPLIQDNRMQPYGLNWDRYGGLLVSMHRREVWRISLQGKVQAIYDTKAAGCPGASEYKSNLRAAIDDPLDENSLFILASNPRSYDAIIWRLSVDDQGKQSCRTVSGTIGGDSGWLDGPGDATVFSRPHYFALRPDSRPPQAIVSDIDNHALRLLNLKTYATSSVMYDRDRRRGDLPLQEQRSKQSCAVLGWSPVPVIMGSSAPASCVRPAGADSMALTLAQAKTYCESAGARLCEPAEIRATKVASGLRVWTGAECASCWQRNAGEHCPADIETYRSPDMRHNHKEYAQSWNSGQALEVGAVADSPALTLCQAVETGLTAAAYCCADSLPAALQAEAGIK